MPVAAQVVHLVTDQVIALENGRPSISAGE